MEGVHLTFPKSWSRRYGAEELDTDLRVVDPALAMQLLVFLAFVATSYLPVAEKQVRYTCRTT